MSKTHSILKLRFSPEDFKKVIKRLYDEETGKFSIDNLIPVPKSLQIPVCTDLVVGSGGYDEMRVCEYAALDYLFSLDEKEFSYLKNVILSIPNERYGFHTFVSNIRNASLSIIASELKRNDFEIRRYNLEQEAERLFEEFYDDNFEELAKNGVITMQDLGRIVVNNLIKYNCVDAETWRSKNQGFGGYNYADGDVYSVGKPKLDVATNGFNSLYFDAYDISTYFLISKMADALGTEGKPMPIDVVEFNTTSEDTMYYNTAKPNSLSNKADANWFSKLDFIEEVNAMFGKEIYSFEDDFDDDFDYSIGPISPLFPNHPSFPINPNYPFIPYTPKNPYIPGVRPRKINFDLELDDLDLDPLYTVSSESETPKTYHK